MCKDTTHWTKVSPVSSVFALDMKLGDYGNNVLGGKIQRLSLARLFLRNPEINLIDEVTPSFNLDTEENLLGALRIFPLIL